ncbi:hypothetical protein P692DRAFT_20840885, partial [Suillus brevipes Sb2]
MADSSLDTLYIHPSTNLQAPACTWWQLAYPGSIVRMRLRIKHRICAIGGPAGAHHTYIFVVDTDPRASRS